MVSNDQSHKHRQDNQWASSAAREEVPTPTCVALREGEYDQARPGYWSEHSKAGGFAQDELRGDGGYAVLQC